MWCQFRKGEARTWVGLSKKGKKRGPLWATEKASAWGQTYLGLSFKTATDCTAV